MILELILYSGLPQPTGAVILLNSGSQNVGVWNMGNQWGAPVLSFEVQYNGFVWRITRREEVYTRNVPSSFVLPAGERYQWRFDLGDGSWIVEIPFDQLTGRQARLVAVYTVSATPEAVAYGVWIGQLRSKPVLLEAPNSESLQT